RSPPDLPAVDRPASRGAGDRARRGGRGAGAAREVPRDRRTAVGFQRPLGPRLETGPPQDELAATAGPHSFVATAVIVRVSGSAGAPTGRGWSEKSAVTTTLPRPGSRTGTRGRDCIGVTSGVLVTPSFGKIVCTGPAPSRQ